LKENKSNQNGQANLFPQTAKQEGSKYFLTLAATENRIPTKPKQIKFIAGPWQSPQDQ
jgi:hypothetical protein